MNTLLTSLQEDVRRDLVTRYDRELAVLTLDGLILQEARQRTSLFDEMTAEAKEQLMHEFRKNGVSPQGLDILSLILDVQISKATVLRLENLSEKLSDLRRAA